MMCHVLSCAPCAERIFCGPSGHRSLLSSQGFRCSASIFRVRVFGMALSFPIPFRSVSAAAGLPLAGPCFARIACARARSSAPARFARLIARARRRTHVSRRLTPGFFGPSRFPAQKSERRPREPPSHCLYHTTLFLRSSPLAGEYEIFPIIGEPGGTRESGPSMGLSSRRACRHPARSSRRGRGRGSGSRSRPCAPAVRRWGRWSRCSLCRRGR